MNGKQRGMAFMASFIIVVVLLAAAAFTARTTVAQDETNGQQDVRTIDTSGRASLSMEPEKVTIYIGAETEGKAAAAAEQENSRIINEVISALKGLGLSEDDIQTSSYSIYPIREYPRYPYEKEITSGYRVSHMIKVETEDTGLAGKIIDAAVEKGANSVGGITFALTDETVLEAKKGLLKLASQEARGKAESIASGLGVGISRVHSAREQTVNYIPYVMDSAVYAGAAKAETAIMPGLVEISADVFVSFELA